MLEFLYLTKYVLLQSFGLFIAIGVGGLFIFWILYKLHSLKKAFFLFAFFFGVFLFIFAPKALPGLQYPFSLTTYGPGEGPVLPLKNVITFFRQLDTMEHVADISPDPNDTGLPIQYNEDGVVEINLIAKEVLGEMADGVQFNYWTYNGTVPGPMLRAKEGDTIKLTLENDPTSLHHHNIDLHAVSGPGGGAGMTLVAPGESKTIIFKALNPGLYVYHCAHQNVPSHMTHGMYGMILIEPEETLPEVDKELYIMQGEFYSVGDIGNKGLQVFSAEKMLNSQPEYIVFNGKTKGTVGNMTANVGDRVRIFFGNGGVNLVSSFHVIGEIFDRVYPEAAIGSEPHTNVQTTIVPAGGATIVDFTLDVPGDYILVDHALARLERGAWGILSVEGEENPEIYSGESDGHEHDH